MGTTFEKAIEVIRELSPDNFARLNDWLEEKKNVGLDEPDRQSTVYEKRLEWLKANREKYGGQDVVLDGDRFLGAAKSYPEGKKIAADVGVTNAFVNYLSRPDEQGFMGTYLF